MFAVGCKKKQQLFTHREVLTLLTLASLKTWSWPALLGTEKRAKRRLYLFQSVNVLCIFYHYATL